MTDALTIPYQFTVYKITNKINGKIYIGKHQTTDINDGYFGSGNQLKRAIKKYGLANFKKEILYIFDNEIDMNAKEKELVTEEFCKQSNNYNICPGGQGGWGYVNSLDMTEKRKNDGKRFGEWHKNHMINDLEYRKKKNR